jgi:DNA polymerase-3 subunit epsilon
MYLFFDTETTGLPRRWNAPITDLSNWPRMVQLAWAVYDTAGTPISSIDYIIQPEGYVIPNEVARIHGISTQRALNEGIALSRVLSEFAESLSQATCIVAHNISFDEKIVGAEFLRKAMPNLLEGRKKICTMQASTDYCRIPSNSPYGGYKWPRLTELHQKLFGASFEEAHNAAVDIAATARCFWELKKRGVIS